MFYLIIFQGVNDHIWLGAADFTEGDWIWVVDFSNVTYTDWRSGQPSNWGGKEDCMHLDKPFRYEWNDAPCSSHMSYICEIEKVYMNMKQFASDVVSVELKYAY